MTNERPDLRAESAAIWEEKAGFWADYMGPQGNNLFRDIIVPAQLGLLELEPNEHVLDVACGGGQFSRVMARLGVSVVAADISPTFVERARRQAEADGLVGIEVSVADATDEASLLALGGPFDAAICGMAVMDLPVIDPLLRAVYKLLRPGGRFVFTIMHPAFWGTRARLIEEQIDSSGGTSIERAIKVTAYLDVPAEKGTGVPGEPQPHFYFHRPIARLLTSCFDAGFVLDGMREPAFTGPPEPKAAFNWANYPQFPLLLLCRLRKV